MSVKYATTKTASIGQNCHGSAANPITDPSGLSGMSTAAASAAAIAAASCLLGRLFQKGLS